MHAALFAALAAALLQVAMAGGDSKVKEIMNTCNKGSSAISQEELKAMLSMKIPSSESGKCFVGCVLEEIGMLKGGGFSSAFAEELAKAKLQEHPEELGEALKLIKKCSDEVAGYDDKCETGPKLLECIKDFASGLGIIEAISA
uniref:Spermatophylax protein 3 n=1 Tax=Gryllodes sigillatus TaxID=13551 RepID=A0A0N9ZRY3_9ORTH|nr:spermatophylax protein 3 [Gryllodes sigillatus]